MAAEIFIDTSAWAALANRRDPHHAIAVGFYPELVRRWPVWVTTNLVVAECYTLVRARSTYEIAMEFLSQLDVSLRLRKVYSHTMLEVRAEDILRRYKDQDFSYVDAVSFVVMQQR